MSPGNASRPLAERFWEKVHKTESCWLWTAPPRNGWGYGQIRVDGKKEYPHRLSYILHKGPIPKDMVILHSCDNRKCVNPDHLSVGTPADNLQDMRNKGRQNDWGRKGPGENVKRYGRKATGKGNAA